MRCEEGGVRCEEGGVRCEEGVGGEDEQEVPRDESGGVRWIVMEGDRVVEERGEKEDEEEEGGGGRVHVEAEGAGGTQKLLE